MINDNIKHQSSGDNSTNIQADTVHIVGMTYQDVREISLDTFKANFVQLKNEAQQEFLNLANGFFENFIKSLKASNPEAIGKFSSPSLQLALYAAQKSFVLSEDKNVEQLLIDALLERTKDTSPLSNIILNSSIEVIQKLTQEQINFLSLSVVLREISVNAVNNDDKINTVYEMIDPFMNACECDLIDIKHLVYAGCGTMLYIGLEDYSIYERFRTSFGIDAQIDDIKKMIVETKPLLSRHAEKLQNSLWNQFSLTSIGKTIGLLNMKKYGLPIGDIASKFLTPKKNNASNSS